MLSNALHMFDMDMGGTIQCWLWFLTTAYQYGIPAVTKDYALFRGSGSVFPKTWANPNKIGGNALMMN